jgi:hypothetical protein
MGPRRVAFGARVARRCAGSGGQVLRGRWGCVLPSAFNTTLGKAPHREYDTGTIDDATRPVPYAAPSKRWWSRQGRKPVSTEARRARLAAASSNFGLIIATSAFGGSLNALDRGGSRAWLRPGADQRGDPIARRVARRPRRLPARSAPRRVDGAAGSRVDLLTLTNHGRLAQRKSTRFTREGSQVQIPHRPPASGGPAGAAGSFVIVVSVRVRP